MKQRPRIYYTEAQKALMWDRWKAGDTLHEIGKLFDRPHTSIHTILSATGDIRPPVRRRSRWALTMSEREEISRALAAGESIRCVASRLKRAASTISRELLRNGGKTGYRAAKADEAAWTRARRPKTCKLASNPALAHIVAVKLQSQWSPEQIAGWLKRIYPGAKDMQVSHEAIYRTLFVQTRGALKKELLEHLRRTRGMRRSRHYTQKTPIHGRIVDAVPISERPACIEDRAVPGHWEGDLLFGDAYSQVATLVERHTRYVMLVKLVDKDSYTVAAALARHAQTLPQELFRSLTWDQGSEIAGHKRFTVATDIQAYFCDSPNPWRRGTNENTNGLLRQYLPKGIDISGYSQDELDAIARKLNERPRKTLGYRTPAEMFNECVASIGLIHSRSAPVLVRPKADTAVHRRTSARGWLLHFWEEIDKMLLGSKSAMRLQMRQGKNKFTKQRNFFA